MATATDFSGLFGGILTPEEQQQQQTEAKALQFAQLSPAQQLAFMGYTSGRQLGQGLAQAAGVDIQDPTIKRAATLRQLAQGIDVTSVEGLKQYAQRLQQAGLTEEAAKLVPRILSMQESLSKQFQQSAAGTASLATAAREKQPTVPPDILKAQRIAALQSAIPAYIASGDTETANQLKAELNVLTATPAAAPTELSRLLSEMSALDPVKDKDKIAFYRDKIKKLTTGGGIASEIVAGLGPVLGTLVAGQTKKAGEEVGKKIGENIATIDNKFETNYALTDALELLSKGIYAGGYAPLEETIAKYGAGILGDKKRLSNTQAFKAYLAEVVIPRLKDFGGSDTIEELKYLQAASGSNTDVEPQALEQILKRAQKKINRGIERIRRQNQELQLGKPVSIDEETTPRPTKRYNPKTGQIEKI